jgi:hypothetical protein
VLKKIVIVAEGAAGAGLTENAGFPMMKTHGNLITTETPRHGEGLILDYFGFSVSRYLRGEMIFSYAHCLP